MVSFHSRDMSLQLMYRANRAQFMDVALRHIDEDEEIVQVNMPTIQGDQDSNGELQVSYRR